MTDKRIDELDAAAALGGSEPIPVYQSGATKRTTADAIRNRAIGSLGSLTAASALTGEEIVGVSQGGNPRRVTTQEIADLVTVDPGAGIRSLTAGWDAGTVNGVDQSLTTGRRVELRAVTGLDPQAWTILPKSGSSGSITIEVRKRPFSSGTFTAITGGSPPSITSGARGTGSATSWTNIDDGDLIEFEITAVSGTVTGATIIIEANGI